jgi:hypothetical protein
MRADGPGPVARALEAYRLRWRRRRYLWRAYRARHDLTTVSVRTGAIAPSAILAFACIRNEAIRLPWFLDHHRALGIGHFLIVDNGSDDGSRDWLAAQPDVSLWVSPRSYRNARFGIDWINRLLRHYGSGHWCLVVDADEALVYPGHDRSDLHALTAWLDRAGRPCLPAMLLEMYPRGRLSEAQYLPGDNPFVALRWFDPGGYRRTAHRRMGMTWIQGGPRERVFFRDRPDMAPTLNKLPLVRWRRDYAFWNGVHALLPRSLNAAHEDSDVPQAVLMHSKFLNDAPHRAGQEKARREHFADPDAMSGYYDALAADPVLWTESSREYRDWRELEDAGLISRGRWQP